MGRMRCVWSRVHFAEKRYVDTRPFSRPRRGGSSQFVDVLLKLALVDLDELVGSDLRHFLV